MSAGSNQRGGRNVGMKCGGGFNHGGKQQQQNSQNRSVVQCYSCGQHGHYAGQCPKTAGSSASNSTGQSVNQRINQAQRHRGSSGARGGRGGNCQGGRRIRFSGLNVLYDIEGYEYQVDDDGTSSWKRKKTTLPHCRRIFIKNRETKKNSHRSSFRAEHCILSVTCGFSGVLE